VASLAITGKADAAVICPEQHQWRSSRHGKWRRWHGSPVAHVAELAQLAHVAHLAQLPEFAKLAQAAQLQNLAERWHICCYDMSIPIYGIYSV